MRVLVTGGTGYIGSHTVVSLLQAGHVVTIVDSLVNSSAVVVDRIAEIAGTRPELHVADLRDSDRLAAIVAADRPEAVIHFAALKAVGESTERPLEYYDNNLSGTTTLLRAMRDHDVRTLVFSSSATVYGSAAPVPYTEDYLPLDAASPYGQTKVMIERICADMAAAEPGWRMAILRYFNPVGAHPSGLIGEDPTGIPANLMPFLAQVAVGRRDRLRIFGGDYPTDDGTCERDYLHVCDLAEGHVAALETIAARATGHGVWNLGTGRPTSVLGMLRAFSDAVGRELPYEIVDRRAGDLAAFWADPTKAHDDLGWHANRTVADMCDDAWRWQSRNPHGFAGASAEAGGQARDVTHESG